MPTTYLERLRLPLEPMEQVCFSTPNGLPLAIGYNRIVLAEKGPMVEFYKDHLILQNMTVPLPLEWRKKHPEAYYAEYRSRDYCDVKVIEQRRPIGKLLAGMWYISPFDLVSDKYPVLIERLKRRKDYD